MATKKERYPFALTIVQNAPSEKVPNYGPFRALTAGRSPGSLPEGLPATLPAQLPYGLPARPQDASAEEKPGTGRGLKPARFPRPSGPPRGQRRPGNGRGRPGPFLREQGQFSRPLEPDLGRLGIPLSIGEVARMIGCSPWSVRQTLIQRGLPHLRFKANGRLIFYRDQVIRWIENQQEGGKTTT
jgi:hypothetical protein